MSQKMKFTRDFWQEWKSDPQGTAQKYGINWSEVDSEWQHKNWKNTSWDEFERLWRKSKWAGWFDWSL